MRAGFPFRSSRAAFAAAAVAAALVPVAAGQPRSVPEIVVEAALAQIGVTVGYDGSYRRLKYPGGDVPLRTGVCTDVLIRAYRAAGIDLQVEVHEDMAAAFRQYPRLWGAARTDRNIDHRRVPNLATFFRRQGVALPALRDADVYLAGDIVTWRLPSGVPHIGLVTHEKRDGRPLVVHNIGAGTRVEDILFAYEITGHYRYPANP